MTQAVAMATTDGGSDGELAQRIVARDSSAFEVLMRRHNRLLYRTARSILRDDQDAEDCVQEAYLQAFRSMQKFRAESRLSTWLVRIVINQALEKLRRHKKEDGDVALDNVVDLEQHLDTMSAMISQPERPAIGCGHCHRLCHGDSPRAFTHWMKR
jgi:RNA polymerase sigma-70 factor, ECF subfamily